MNMNKAVLESLLHTCTLQFDLATGNIEKMQDGTNYMEETKFFQSIQRSVLAM